MLPPSPPTLILQGTAPAQRPTPPVPRPSHRALWPCYGLLWGLLPLLGLPFCCRAQSDFAKAYMWIWSLPSLRSSGLPHQGQSPRTPTPLLSTWPLPLSHAGPSWGTAAPVQPTEPTEAGGRASPRGFCPRLLRAQHAGLSSRPLLRGLSGFRHKGPTVLPTHPIAAPSSLCRCPAFVSSFTVCVPRRT